VRWERPDVVDPGRPRLFGHLAFNVGPRHCVGAHLARMEGTEAILGLWRAFPDLAGAAPGVPAAAPIGFVSRAWRPVHLVHAPVSPDIARERVLLTPERAPRSAAGYGSPHPG
jgi:cytochrome P450